MPCCYIWFCAGFPGCSNCILALFGFSPRRLNQAARCVARAPRLWYQPSTARWVINNLWRVICAELPFLVLILLLWSLRASLSVYALCAIIAGTRGGCVLPCTSASLRLPRDGCPSGPSNIWRDGAASRCGRECRCHVCSRGHVFPRSGRFCSRSPSGVQVCCSCLATSEYENSRRLGVDISVHLSLKKNRFLAKPKQFSTRTSSLLDAHQYLQDISKQRGNCETS